MVMTKSMLVKLLNMDLELEYSSAIQYINHASLITRTALYRNTARQITLNALEEAQHAVMLANQIALLGGIPSIQIARVHTADNEHQMLRHDLEDERDSIRRYQTRIIQAEQLQEFDLAQQLRFMLEMEQEHEGDFQREPSMRPRERQLPIVEIIDNNHFSEKWQERALHVPVRTKLYP